MSISPKKYDVFISFRGEDVRKSFTGHLHEALIKEKIETYIDLYLKVGDEVGPMIVQAIEESHMSIVVFSKNFASSKWCLEELLHILRCRKHHGQVVIPVFYETDPSHVGCLTGSYERAIARYERELLNNECDIDKVSAWKAALVEAAAISGRLSRHFRNDCQMIQFIVKDVSQKLSLLYPNQLKDLVQIDEKSEDIENHLEMVPRIGIWGMSGLGKTTIARHLFAKHLAQYDNTCFLESVNEGSEKLGLPYLRDKLLCDLLNQRTTDTSSIKRRFSDKKVLLVLDDVDSVEQLGYLCGEIDDLGVGTQSRLIITTRNRDILNGRVDLIYEVKKWMLEESLELFSLKAFKQSHPKKGYEGFSEKAVAYARGVPLALKVLGSHFQYSKKNLEFWETELNYLENKGEIEDVMRVSYNGLEEEEKEMFLDIAFFFKDENKDFVTRILDACGFNATSGLHVLKDKALITISNDNKIQMHDLLQKMAFDMVRYQQKGHGSQLRDSAQVRDVLQNNKGTYNNKVEGILFDLTQNVDLHVQADTFNMMAELRFLRLYVPLGKKRLAIVSPPEDILPFCDKLRYLEWTGFPLKSLPQPFSAELLVEIRLPHSDVEHLWHGMQELVNLEGIDLSWCKHLIELPDLSGASKLKWLYLSSCESLCEVPSYIFSKDTLVNLLLDRCTKLESLISEKHLTSLENINIYGCLSLKEFSVSSDSIERLNLSNTGIEILHSSIGGMSKLVWLKLEGLRLQNLPNELSCLRSLTRLLLSNCDIVTKSKLEDIFDGGLQESLNTLHLKDCCQLFELPANIGLLSSLYELRLDGSSVEMLPTTITNLLMLEIMSLNSCRKLCCLPELPPHMKEFSAENCTSLVTVSTLKTFSKHMEGVEKYISFKNGMELDGPSLNLIAEDIILTMKSAALHNVLVDKRCVETHSYNYDSAVVCLPGSRVPRQFKYRATDSSSITIALPGISNSLGLIFSVVLVSVSPYNEVGNGAKIQCQCYREDGSKIGFPSEWQYSKPIMNLNMDHVFVWYDPYRFGIIRYISEGNVSFEFSVTTDSGERDCFLSVKECGICPIYTSEFSKILGILKLDKDVESYMRRHIQSDEELERIEIYHEKEGNDICTQTQNQ